MQDDNRKLYKLVERYLELDKVVIDGFISRSSVEPKKYAQAVIDRGAIEKKLQKMITEHKYGK